MDLQILYQHLIGKIEHSLFHIETPAESEQDGHIPLCQYSIKLLEGSNFLSFHSNDHYSLLALSPLDKVFLSNYRTADLHFNISLEKIGNPPPGNHVNVHLPTKKSGLSFSSLIIDSPEIVTGLYRIMAQLLFLPQELSEEEALFLFQDMDVLEIYNCTAVKS